MLAINKLYIIYLYIHWKILHVYALCVYLLLKMFRLNLVLNSVRSRQIISVRDIML